MKEIWKSMWRIFVCITIERWEKSEFLKLERQVTCQEERQMFRNFSYRLLRASNFESSCGISDSDLSNSN